MPYFSAKVQLTIGDEKPKKKVETFLVKDEVISGVEAKIANLFKDYSQDWKLKEVKESNIVEVVE